MLRRVWNVETGTKIREIPLHEFNPRYILNPSGLRADPNIRAHVAFFKTLAVISYEHGLIQVYNIDNNCLLCEWRQEAEMRLPCLLVHNGNAIIHGTREGHVVFRNLAATSSQAKSNVPVVLAAESEHDYNSNMYLTLHKPATCGRRGRWQ